MAKQYTNDDLRNWLAPGMREAFDALVKAASERDTAVKDFEAMQNDRNGLQSQLDDMQGEGLREVLLDVRDWMHEPLFLNRPMRDPHAILRQVERAL